MKLRTQMLWLVLGLAVPFVLLMGGFAMFLAQREQTATLRGLEATDRALATALENEVHGSVHALEALAASNDLRTGDVESFRRDLTRVPHVGRDWHALMLLDAAGQRLARVASPTTDDEGRTDFSDAEWLGTVKQTRAPTIAAKATQVGSQQRLAVPVAVPVIQDDGSVSHVLAALFDVGRLNDVIARQGISASSSYTVGVVDANQTIIARSRAADQFVGTPITPQFASEIDSRDEGRFEAMSKEGIASIGYFVRLPSTGWVIALSAPREAMLAPGRQYGWMVAAGSALLLAAGLGIASVFERRIVRAIVVVRDAARALGQGASLPALPDVKVREVDQLATEMGRAAELLDDRQQQRSAAEAALRRSEARFRDFAESASDWLWEVGPDLKFTYLSPRIEVVTGRPVTEFIGKARSEVTTIAPGAEAMRSYAEAVAARQPFRDLDLPWTGADGRIRWARISGRPVIDAAGTFLGYRGVGADVTGQVETEDRLRQSEKMEAVGQLTGGLAHDFNNTLTVIIGTMEEIAETPEMDPGERQDALGRALNAAERGAELIRGLLAFARKQPLQPRLIDINATVAETDQLLRRTLGAQIDLITMLGEGVWSVNADPTQLQSALVNLAVNARDAMPNGGKLTIETRNTVLDEDYARDNPGARPGDYAVLAISDTGTGIPAAIISHVFDPFFTTKAVGKGTGLGLSMVYGFIKQSNGHVKIYSEEGHGTTIRLYLPRVMATADKPKPAFELTATDRGNETILIVEDDPMVLTFVDKQLRGLGYRTLAAKTGSEALQTLRTGQPIDLLLTDVILPGGMTGKQLAEAAVQVRPGLRVLYTSGYTENAIQHHGRLDPGVLLLSKPYRAAELARMVRIALLRTGTRAETAG